MSKVNPDDFFGPAAGTKSSVNPDDYFGPVAEKKPEPEGVMSRVGSAIKDAAIASASLVAGKDFAKPADESITADPLSKPSAEKPVKDDLLASRGNAPLSEEAFGQIKASLAAMPREQRQAAVSRKQLPGWMRGAMSEALRQIDLEDKGSERVEDFKSRAQQQDKERDRTTVEFGRDLLLSGLEGIGTLNQIAANVVSPDSQWGKDTEATIQAIRSDQSIQKQYQDLQRASRVKDAGGEFSQFSQQLWELISSPTAAVEEIVRQGPLMAAMIGTTLLGGSAGAAAVGLAGRAVPSIAIADAIGGGAVTATARAGGMLASGRAAGGIASAGDAGSQVFQQLSDKQKTPDSVLLDNQDFKRIFQENLDRGMDGRQALDAARTSIAVTRSRLAQAIAAPLGAVSGGIGLEKVLAYGLKGVGKREAAKELAGETAEEVGTQMAGNAAVGTVDPRQALMEGTGQVAATSLVTSSPLAALTGYMARTPPTEALPPTQVRAEALKRFDELAAAFGLSAAAAKAVRTQAGNKSADEAPGFLARAVVALNSRGFFSKPLDDAGVRSLDQSLTAPASVTQMPGVPNVALSPTAPVAPVAPNPATAAPFDAGALLGTPTDEAHAEQAKPTDLMTGDGMPYGSQAGAKARANKDGGEVVPVVGGWVVRPSVDTGVPQNSGDRLSADPKGDGNSGLTEAGQPQGFDSLGVNGKSMVKRSVLAAINDQQVLGSVVELVPVDVMNVLAGGELSAESLRRNPSVLLERLSSSFDDPVVATSVARFVDAVASSHPDAFAGLPAKVQAALGVGNSPRVNAESNPAGGAANVGSHSANYSEGGKDANRPDLAVPATQPTDSGAAGTPVPVGSSGPDGLWPADAGGGIQAPAAGPVGSSGEAVAAGVPADQPPSALSDTPDFENTWPAPVQNPDGKGSAFEGLEGEYLANAITGIHQEVGFSVQADAASARALIEGIGSGVDPATGKQADPERLKAMRQELRDALDGIDSTLGDYAGEFGDKHKQAFQDKLLPDLGDMLAQAEEIEKPADQGSNERTLDEDGRASDGKPIKPGDVFRTSSGRGTTPYPKQKGEKYASQWLIENAVAEAESRGDDFNAGSFRGEKAGRDGGLAPASRDSMLMYLFGQQPKVAPQILSPLSTEDQNPIKKPVSDKAKRALEGIGKILKPAAEAPSVTSGVAVEPAPAAGTPDHWSKSEFAPRINAALNSLEDTGIAAAADLARVIRLGLDREKKPIDEARAAFTESLVNREMSRWHPQAVPWEPMTLEALRAEDGVIKALPDPIVQAAVTRLNELGPRLARHGFKSQDEVNGSHPVSANDIAREMRDVVGALLGLAPARYSEAIQRKNVNPKTIGRAEDFASRVLNIDTRAHPGVDTTDIIGSGGAKKRAQKKAKQVATHPKTVWGSHLLAEISRQKGGLSPDLLHDLSFRKETGKFHANGKAQFVWFNPPVYGIKGGLFREGGVGDTNELAEWMEEEGYIPIGTMADDYKKGDELARTLVTKALNRDEPKTELEITSEADDYAKREREAWDALSDEEKAASMAADGFYPELDPNAAEQIEADRREIMEDEGISAADDSEVDPGDWAGDGDISWDNTERGLRNLGFTDEEIELERQAYEKEKRSSQEGAGPGVVDGASKAGAVPADATPSPRPASEGADQETLRSRADEAIADLYDGQAMSLASALGVDTSTLSPQDARTILLTKNPADVMREIAPVLESYSESDLRQKAEREQRTADEAKAKKAAEQARLAKEAAERDLKHRADQTVDDFELGQSAEQQMSGIADMFSEPVSQVAPNRDETLVALRKRLSVLKSLRECLG